MTFSRHKVIFSVLVLVLITTVVASLKILNPDSSQVSNQEVASTPTPSVEPKYANEEQIPSLTLDGILSGKPAFPLNKLNPDKLLTVVITGDIIPARGVDAKIRQFGPSFPFAGDGIVELLKSGDITISSLEAPVIQDCPVHNEGFTFCGQHTFAQAMAEAGIDIVTLENNHIGNYGQNGIKETINHLQTAGINYATSSRLAISKIKGLNIGVLSFNGVGRTFDRESITTQIKLARPQVELLFVAFHWGKEYQLTPKADANIAPDNPREIAELAINEGADFIIGNHPHWVQGVELIKDKLVNYAYGNFIFDQSWSTETLQSYVGSYIFYETKLIQVTMHPTIIKYQAQPYVAQDMEHQTIVNRIKQSSIGISKSKAE